MSRPCRGGKGPPARAARRQPKTPAQMHDKLYGLLRDEVPPLVTRCFDQEKTWTECDMTRRIVGYLYKSGKNPDLLKLDWMEACQTFVSHAMQSYACACQSRAWFHHIELGPVLARAAFEILSVNTASELPPWEDVLDITTEKYHAYLDECLTQEAIRRTANKHFSDEKIRSKVSAVLQKTHKQAVDHARLQDNVKTPVVEAFVRKWMGDGLSRIWSVMSDEKRGELTESLAVKLFHRLIAPFGVEHEFSCIPCTLYTNIGRPPPDWDFVANSARNIFRSWEQQSSGSSKKKPAVRARLEEAPGADFHEEEPAPDERGSDQGHPRCTSGADCQGSSRDPLIQHLVDGAVGDIYCEKCWKSFLEMHPALKGNQLFEP